MEQFDFDGHRVAYTRSGRGPAMVFLHNGGNDHRIWDFQVAHFASTHEVFAVDLLGYGGSDRPEVDYTLPLYVGMVEGLVTRHQLERPVLVGNCMGSGIALGYAAVHPDRVAALVLCNVLTERVALAGNLGLLHRLTVRPSAGRRATAALARRLTIPRWADRATLAMQYGDGRPDAEMVAHAREINRRPGGLRALFSLFCHLDSFGELDRLGPSAGLPRLAVVWGESNRVLPAAAGRALVERLTPADSWFVSGAGHLVMRERHHEINQYIERFLAA